MLVGAIPAGGDCCRGVAYSKEEAGLKTQLPFLLSLLQISGNAIIVTYCGGRFAMSGPNGKEF